MSQTATPAPSFVARHPVLPVLYAVNEIERGTITAFATDRRVGEAGLVPLGGCPTGGGSPCHAVVGSSGGHLFVANYGSGSVAAVRLDAAGVPLEHQVVGHSGRGPDPQRQNGPHAHMVVPTGDGVLAVDLGTDAVYRHRLDPVTGQLRAGEPVIRFRPGTGPRHLTSDATGRLHVVGELNATITTLEPSASTWREVCTVPSTSAAAALPSAIVASGPSLYVANRGPDTIAVFDLTGPRPTLVGEVSSGGSWPRDLIVVGRHLYAANERSHTIVTFLIDPGTGLPRPTGDVLLTASPTCLLPRGAESVTRHR